MTAQDFWRYVTWIFIIPVSLASCAAFLFYMGYKLGCDAYKLGCDAYDHLTRYDNDER